MAMPAGASGVSDACSTSLPVPAGVSLPPTSWTVSGPVLGARNNLWPNLRAWPKWPKPNIPK
ncbi:hypothetical protein E2562_031821 [Oryza meyeriana var. granulata]|uniref:Uncharacterized protein n=1 Tax=Oryza meyeriana var. granulata TaxID=110450 RepID=A0A6G1EC62_9ORYZ|nr:hypothetical protein E2562_031821 [Oryza meyeriana var. granulata]